MPTIHQYPHGFILAWQSGPAWLRAPSPELKALRKDGLKVLKVQLQDNGEVPRWLCDMYRTLGYQVWGMVGHVHDWEQDPKGLAAWLKAERVRLALTGLDCNFEDEVNGFDARSGGHWSEQFAFEARRLMPTLSLHLDSYWGPMGDKINLGAYKARGFRFTVQTFWGQPPIMWADPPTNIVRKGQGAQPVIGKSIIKPIILVTPRDDGELVDPDMAIFDTKHAGTIGLGFYYLDGADVNWLRDFIRKARTAGVCA